MIKHNLLESFQNIVYHGQAGSSKRERNKGRILIVDEQIDIITPLCDFFSEKGYKTEGYSSEKDALKALKEQDFDLLLTDLTMPEFDGLELIKLIHEIDPLMVCIAITGNGTVQTAFDALKAGAFDYILKPFKMRNILSVVTRAMEMRRLRDSEKKYRAIVEDQT